MKTKITFLLSIIIILNGFSQNLNFINKTDKLIARSASASSKDSSNDLVYIANGFSTTNQYTSEIEIYNFSTNSWSLLSSSTPSIPKKFGNAEVLTNSLYLFNGQTSNGINDKLEIINLTNGNLTINSTLNPNPVFGAGSSMWGDNLISFGGCSDAFNAVYSKKLYKIAPWGTWTQLADMPAGLQTKGEVIYNATNSKLYVFGGYSETNNTSENFEDITTNTDINLTDWINVAESGTKLFKGKSFAANKYAEISAFDSNVANQEASNVSWLISNPITAISASPVFLNFDTKDGYNNGAALEVYFITNWTGDITTSTKTLLPATIATGSTSGYATRFTDSGNILLNGDLTNFRIGFKYVGGYSPIATTTYQIDNFRVYKSNKSNNIYVYDFNNNSWITSNTILPQSLSGYSIARNEVSNSQLYISGDYDNQTFTGVYDTTNNTFTNLTQTNMIGRRHHTSEFWNDNLYIFGGNTSTAISSSISSTQSADLSTLSSNNFDKENITFYPNPTKSIINFNKELKFVSVYSVDGKKIIDENIKNQFDASKLTNGIYIIIGVDNDGLVFKDKFVKE
ncbi:MAG: hypothetical protein NT048_00595 [Flavobacterium sp.]|nr:hypothetical protein [Flavobacterium sp.]